MPLPHRLRLALFLASALALLAVGHLLHRFAGAQDPCPGASTPLVVTSRDRTLWICETGRATAHLHVSLGSAGLGKRVEGDRRTPLGTYTLAAPRPSPRFGTFIPLDYPTDAQRRKGFTGAEVGIHGPERHLRWLGPANTWLDWTAGCVAVADDEQLARVAQIVRRGSAAITIR